METQHSRRFHETESMFAYVMHEGGQQSLWLRQVAVESNVRILPARSGHYLGIAFSPDSNYIYYGYVAAISGRNCTSPGARMGAAAMRINLYTGPQAVSHDGGKAVAFFQYDDQKQEDRLIVANADAAANMWSQEEVPQRFGWNWDAGPRGPLTMKNKRGPR